LRWLREHAPGDTDLVLVHGDFRVGNLMVGPGGLVGVFDWEFSHVGDPAEDLAWPCVRSWRFGQDALSLGGVGEPEEFREASERAGGRAVDRRPCTTGKSWATCAGQSAASPRPTGPCRARRRASNWPAWAGGRPRWSWNCWT